MGLETTCHYLLYCSSFIIHRKTLYDNVNRILREYNIPFLTDDFFVDLLLYGDVKFTFEENQNILKATINLHKEYYSLFPNVDGSPLTDLILPLPPFYLLPFLFRQPTRIGVIICVCGFCFLVLLTLIYFFITL